MALEKMRFGSAQESDYVLWEWQGFQLFETGECARLERRDGVGTEVSGDGLRIVCGTSWTLRCSKDASDVRSENVLLCMCVIGLKRKELVVLSVLLDDVLWDSRDVNFVRPANTLSSREVIELVSRALLELE